MFKKMIIVILLILILFNLTGCIEDKNIIVDGKLIYQNFKLDVTNEIFLIYGNRNTIFIQNEELISRVVNIIRNIKADTVEIIKGFPETDYELSFRNSERIGCNIQYSSTENIIYINYIDLYNNYGSGPYIIDVYKIPMNSEFKEIIKEMVDGRWPIG